LNIVILGLSVTSSWGNGHATTYRSLIRGLAERGHRVLFLERDALWYSENRDDPTPAGVRTEIYNSLDELITKFEKAVSEADFVIVGSFVPEGITVGKWVTAVAQGLTAFYDIDTPVTMEQLERNSCEYVTPELIRSYDLYLSFTGGPTLRTIENRIGSPMARPLYCSVDPKKYFPMLRKPRWDLGYLGTYSDDRQPSLDNLMLEPARHWREGAFIVAGPLYPESIVWPENVERRFHLSPREHPAFYAEQKFTLNITREAMKRAGYSPSVRLFEAGACGVPILSDWWPGLDDIFMPSREILLTTGPEDTLRYLRDFSHAERMKIGQAARARIVSEHTPEIRAAQLEAWFAEAGGHVLNKTATAETTTVSR
jgi:spore maturation protein CgeB